MQTEDAKFDTEQPVRGPEIKMAYAYHPKTGEYLDEIPVSQDPEVANSYLIPANATDVCPPQTTPRYIAVFNEETQSWNIEADNRGWVFNKSNPADRKTIQAIGSLDELGMSDYTHIPPPTSFPEGAGISDYHLEGTLWVLNEDKRMARLAAEARQKRNTLLTITDYTQLPDVPLAPSKKEEFRNYRQKLRDVPGQPGFPSIVSFPAEVEYTKS